MPAEADEADRRHWILGVAGADRVSALGQRAPPPGGGDVAGDGIVSWLNAFRWTKRSRVPLRRTKRVLSGREACAVCYARGNRRRYGRNAHAFRYEGTKRSRVPLQSGSEVEGGGGGCGYRSLRRSRIVRAEEVADGAEFSVVGPEEVSWLKRIESVEVSAPTSWERLKASVSGGVTGTVVLAMEVGVFRDVHASVPRGEPSVRAGGGGSADLGKRAEAGVSGFAGSTPTVEGVANAGFFGVSEASKAPVPPLGRQSSETISWARSGRGQVSPARAISPKMSAVVFTKRRAKERDDFRCRLRNGVGVDAKAGGDKRELSRTNCESRPDRGGGPRRGGGDEGVWF